MSYSTMLKKLSAAKLRKLLAQKERLEKVVPLERKRDRLLKKAAKIQKQIDRLLMKEPGVPGRPPRKRKFSAAARRKIAVALRRHWAKVRAKKKAQSKGRKAGGRAKIRAAATAPAASDAQV